MNEVKQAPLLMARDLVKVYGRRNSTPAVDGVSFSVAPGETLALVGESGSGKSTVGRMVLRLTEATSGSIELNGVDVRAQSRQSIRRMRRSMQMVFQDPYSSLNPRIRVGDAVREALVIHGLSSPGTMRADIDELFDLVGLSASLVRRYPHELSGGQRQRVAIARAVAVRPSLIVLDEPTSALDVSVQSQVLKLLVELQLSLGSSYLFISHDMAVVRYMADNVAVMNRGRLVEIGSAQDVLERPHDSYTKKLLAAVPKTPRIS